MDAGQTRYAQATQAWPPTLAKLLRRGDHGERQHDGRRRQTLRFPAVRRRRLPGLTLGNHRDFQVFPALLARMHLARIRRELHVARGFSEGLLADKVLGLKAGHLCAVPLDQRPHRLGTEVRSRQLVQQFAGRRERHLRRQPATVLLHRLGVTLTRDAQQFVGRIRPVRAARAFPIATPEGDRADGAHESAFFRPPVFLLAPADAGAERRPFFSAASMRRATAAPSIWVCSSRPFSRTAPSQASKTVPSGAVRANCSISSARAKARRTSASCWTSTSIKTVVLIEHPCSGVKKPVALVYPISDITTREVGYTLGSVGPAPRPGRLRGRLTRGWRETCDMSGACCRTPCRDTYYDSALNQGRTTTFPLPSIQFSVSAPYPPAGLLTPPMLSAFTFSVPLRPSGESVLILL